MIKLLWEFARDRQRSSTNVVPYSNKHTDVCKATVEDSGVAIKV